MKRELIIKPWFLIICWTLIFYSVSFDKAHAANRVTVATIGSFPPEKEKGMGNEKLVEQVIEFWKQELKQVLPSKPDLIVLPEVSDIPANLPRGAERIEYCRTRKDLVQNYFASVARTNHCYLVFGSYHEEQVGIWRNSSIILDREGRVAGVYNKNFPTINEIEAGVKPGTEAPVFKCDFGTIACAICYDLNFMELCNQYAAQKPNIILFSSVYHGGIMQADWAYTCRSFFVGAIGKEGIPSEIRDPQGDVLASSTNYFDFAVTAINLDTEIAHLDFNWGKLKQLKEKYGNKVTIKDPGKLGSVLITSEHESISAKDMVKEFGIELLDDYFNRSRAFREKNITVQSK